MARFRVRKQTVWKAHSLLGIVAGLGLLVIGLTGSVLLFSKEIDGLLRPGVVRVEPGPSRPPWTNSSRASRPPSPATN